MCFPCSFPYVMHWTSCAAITVKLHIYRRKSNLISTFTGTRLSVLVSLNSSGTGNPSNTYNKSIINPSHVKHPLCVMAELCHPALPLLLGHASLLLSVANLTLKDLTRVDLLHHEFWVAMNSPIMCFMLNDNIYNSFCSGQRMKRHQRHFRSTLLENLTPKVGRGFGLPGLLEGVPAHGRGIGNRGYRRHLPTQTILWFYYSMK